MSTERFAELDAVRGLAACVVVLRHFVNLWPREQGGIILWILLRSPVRFFLGAHEAVLLFFLLSGFVLTLPFLRAPQIYGAFLVRRVFRIYVPYLGALALAVLGALYLHAVIPSLSGWFGLTWSKPVALPLVVQHVLFLGQYDCSQFNTAFWSLVYEMRISLIFPVLFWMVAKLGNRGSAALALFLSVCAWGSKVTNPYQGDWAMTLHYAGVFIVGSLMARNLSAIRQFFLQLSRTRRVAVTIVALCFITYGQGVPSLRARLYPLMDWLVVAGAAWLVILALCSVCVRTWLLSRIPQYLGRISYSLYLIHGTVLFALVHLLYPRVPLLAIFPIYLVTALVIASGFNSFVEEPCMKIGRKGGQIFAAAWTRLIPETHRA